jgi:malonyl-CoA decarboxylase
MPTLGLDRASLSNLLSTLTERGRSLLGLSNGARPMSQAELIGLGETLLSRRGEATGVALANTLLAGYSQRRKPISSPSSMRWLSCSVPTWTI